MSLDRTIVGAGIVIGLMFFLVFWIVPKHETPRMIEIESSRPAGPSVTPSVAKSPEASGPGSSRAQEAVRPTPPLPDKIGAVLPLLMPSESPYEESSAAKLRAFQKVRDDYDKTLLPIIDINTFHGQYLAKTLVPVAKASITLAISEGFNDAVVYHAMQVLAADPAGADWLRSTFLEVSRTGSGSEPGFASASGYPLLSVLAQKTSAAAAEVVALKPTIAADPAVIDEFSRRTVADFNAQVLHRYLDIIGSSALKAKTDR